MLTLHLRFGLEKPSYPYSSCVLVIWKCVMKSHTDKSEVHSGKIISSSRSCDALDQTPHSLVAEDEIIWYIHCIRVTKHTHKWHKNVSLHTPATIKLDSSQQELGVTSILWFDARMSRALCSWVAVQPWAIAFHRSWATRANPVVGLHSIAHKNLDNYSICALPLCSILIVAIFCFILYLACSQCFYWRDKTNN